MPNLKDVKRKPIMLELGDNSYEFMYSLEAFAAIEEVYGSVDAGLKTIEAGKIKDIKFFIHAGLLHLDNAPTEVEIAKKIDVRNLSLIMNCIMEALTIDSPAPVDKATSPNQ